MRILRAVLRRHRLASFALTHIMCAYITAHVPVRPPAAEQLHLLCKNAPNIPLTKAQKARSPIIFCQKGFPMSFFLAARRFSGTAFCRRNEIRSSFRVFYRQLRISIRARRRKRLYLPLFRALPCASSLSLSMIVFRKIRAVFALWAHLRSRP